MMVLVKNPWVEMVHGHGRFADESEQADEERSLGNWTNVHQVNFFFPRTGR